MKNKMTDEAIRTVINNAPEGAEYWTSGYDVGYRKLVLDCVFGWIPDDAKWVRAIDNDIAIERIDKGFWIPNLVKELVERQSKPIPQTKEVEWVNGLPPVGVECLYAFGGNDCSEWFRCEILYVGKQCVFIKTKDENLIKSFGCEELSVEICNTKFRKPETKEDREKREREENGEAMYIQHCKNLGLDKTYWNEKNAASKEAWCKLAEQYRKGGE